MTDLIAPSGGGELFPAFWVLNMAAVMQIRLAVCPTYEDVHCPIRSLIKLAGW